MREELDFKTLRFFTTLYRLGNVSLSADTLKISQPTGSQLLKKLRDYFDDPLFVRIGQRMTPTPRADDVARTVFAILQLVDHDLPGNPEFIPQTSTRNFTLGLTDISQMTLLPPLQAHLRHSGAEGITFSVVNIDDHTPAALESGQCDLAIGYLMDMPDNFYQQRLLINSMSAWQQKIIPGSTQPLPPNTGAVKSIWPFTWRGPGMATLISYSMPIACHGIRPLRCQAFWGPERSWQTVS